MDVHHHPDLEHKEKKIKEYFLEFLMIFLAVTLGFFAESLREKMNDHEYEQEYIEHIKDNLVVDTHNLNIWIPALYQRMDNLDTLIDILNKPGFTNYGSRMYYLARISTRIGSFEFTDNSIQELKNSGNFRIVRKQNIINQLVEYEQFKDNYEGLYAIELKENDLAYPLIGNLFDATIFDKMLVISDTSNFSAIRFAVGRMNYIIPPPGNPQLRNQDKDKINLLIYYLHQRKSSFNSEIMLMKKQKQKVAELIQLLDKEYDLNDE